MRVGKTDLQYLKQLGLEMDNDVAEFAEYVEDLRNARTLEMARDRLDSIDAFVQNWVLYIARARRRGMA